jgi:hypothetical protein
MVQRAILNFIPGPQGWASSLGVKFVPYVYCFVHLQGWTLTTV